ncbi:putative protein translocase subunit SECA2, chloroplastic-like isoform X1 [Capsicum annuum]|nr:putative protein translocase subunit SECA2, chloroplastic-like isoform X1 [Capsicum annuum]
MRQFDPWPIFFRREWSRNWPFLVGFAVTGTIITKLSLGFTEEDRKNSRFAQRHKNAWASWVVESPSAVATALKTLPRMRSLVLTISSCKLLVARVIMLL